MRSNCPMKAAFDLLVDCNLGSKIAEPDAAQACCRREPTLESLKKGRPVQGSHEYRLRWPPRGSIAGPH